MSNNAISVENISKLYRIGVAAASHESLASAVVDFLRSPISNYKKYRSLYDFGDVDIDDSGESNSADILWALRGLSFNIQRLQFQMHIAFYTHLIHLSES